VDEVRVMSDRHDAAPRIAIFSPFYYPELISTGRVNTLLAKELVRLGWEVDVVCSHPLYPDWKPTKSSANLLSTKTHRGGAWVYYASHPLLRRVALEVWFAMHAVKCVLSLRKDTAVALLVYPPSLFGPLVQMLLPRRVRRVALVHDLQGEYSQLGYHSGFKLLTYVINKVEKVCLSGADSCIFFSKAMARAAQSLFALDDAHMSVQYPFVTLDGDAVMTEALERVLPTGVQHVVYSGALGEKQNPEELAELMQQAAKAIPEAQFHIFSGGPIFDSLRKKFASMNELHFHDLVPEEQLTELYARSSVQLIPQAHGTESGSLPSKLPNLLAAGVQTVALCAETSEVAGLLRESTTDALICEWSADQFLSSVQAALMLAAEVSPETRRVQAENVLALCRVASLAQLVVGCGTTELEPALMAAAR
jgi:colanic acid biosynthesis glycosyl transferase WcaI